MRRKLRKKWLQYEIRRESTEKALREAEEALWKAIVRAEDERAKLESVLAAIGDGISIQDTNFVILYQNQVHKEVVGDHVGEYCYRAYAHQKSVCKSCPLAVCFEDGKIHTVERSMTTNNGVIHVEITVSPLRDSSGEIVAGIEVVRDITERKRIEEELRRYREQLEELVQERTAELRQEIAERRRFEEELRLLQRINNAMNTGVVMDEVLKIAVEGVKALYDYAACDIFLLEDNKKELMYAALAMDTNILRQIEKLTGLKAHGLRIPLFEGSGFKRVLESKKVYFTEDIVKVFEDFTDNKMLKLLAAPVASLSGFKSVIRAPLVVENEAIGIIGVASKRSVTEKDAEVLERFASQIALVIRKGRLEEGLRESEEKYRALMDDAGDAILLADTEGNLLEVNKKAKELFGYTKEEFLNMKYVQVYPEEEQRRASAAFKQMVAKGSGSLNDVLVRTKDGRTVAVDVTSSVVEYAGKKVVQGIFRDITERKKSEEALREAERSAAKGIVAAEIAHEINNSLANIETALFIINNIHTSSRYRQDILKDVSEEIDRMSGIVKGILEVYRSDDSVIQPVDINAEVLKVIKLTQRRLDGKGISVVSNLLHDLPSIPCHPGHIKQILLNLIKNAEEAMSSSPKKLISISTEKEGSFIKLKVKDTGCGIPEERKNVIFNHLFSSRAELSGLGLPICRQIAKKYGGDVKIESKEGKGTTVTIYLSTEKHG